jgi:hypothetical protein
MATAAAKPPTVINAERHMGWDRCGTSRSGHSDGVIGGVPRHATCRYGLRRQNGSAGGEAQPRI